MSKPENDYILRTNRKRILGAWNRATELFRLELGSDWETNEVISMFGLKTPFQTARGK